MKRPLKPEDVRIWGMVAATVHPLPGRAAPRPAATAADSAAAIPTANAAVPKPVPPKPGPPRKQVEVIEPRRRHRIAKARDVGPRLDLHGLDQDHAKAVLEGFIRRAWDDGYRAVLIITGKGVQGDGVLKRRTPEWLAAPHLSAIVAGISDAARHHGGEGALYVALKRKPGP